MDNDLQGTPCAGNRFVPASALDFARYAKNLAWLLGVKLQEAQELLSQIYGFEHLHELQQALKSGLPPGPFWDDGPNEHKVETGVVLLAGMPGERSMRPVKVLCTWKEKRGMNPWLEKNEALIVELGLTDSPASHRDCVRRVKRYLLEEYSADAHGYPTGFWSLLAGYRFDSVQFEQASMRLLLEASRKDGDAWTSHSSAPVSYTAQLACAVLSRAVDVLGQLGERIEHEEVAWNFAFEDDEDLGWDSMWQTLSHDGQLRDGDDWQNVCAAFVFRSAQEASPPDEFEETWEALRAFVEWPSEAKLKACGVDLSFKDAVERVSRWRLGWMMAAVSQWQSSAPRIVRLTGQTAQRNEKGWWVTDPDFACLVMKRRPQYDFEDSISLMDVLGTLIIEEPDGSRQIGGLVKGWHFSPVDAYYADFNEVDEFLQSADAEDTALDKGWQVVRQYMAMRGIADMEAWVNSEEGCAMTLLRMTLDPGIDSDETRARFIRLIAECFDEDGGRYTTSDYLINGNDLMDDFYDENDDLLIRTPGLLVMSVPGLQGVGFSIAEDDGQGRQIMVMGGGHAHESRARLRRYAQRGIRQESEFDTERARVRKLLQKVVDPPIDVAVLDLAAQENED